jgi:leucyl aminopeptidase
MNRIDIFFVYDTINEKKYSIVQTQENSTKLIINVFNLSVYKLRKELDKINSIITLNEKSSNQIERINVIFDKKIDIENANTILGKLNDKLYSYYPMTKAIKLFKVHESSSNYMNELFKYKDIVMDPNKTPDTYLNYVKSNIPTDYKVTVFNLNETKQFPLTKGVGLGSSHPSYFVHISPAKINPNNKNIFLIGKSVTFDTGGLNLKTKNMEEMKTDMTGSAIIISVLKLLNLNKKDSKFNVHLLIPIVENMIGNKGIRPGSVLKSTGGKLIEITNTDAEGRLCIVDAFDYIHFKLIKDLDLDVSKCIIIDVATLTGNTVQITSGMSSLAMCNNKGLLYLDELIKIGENIGEYVDFLKIREEYLDMLNSSVADIVNVNLTGEAGCIIAGTFLNYFVSNKIAWIHIDLGVCTFVDLKPISYGINLLYEFILKIGN